MFVFLTESWWQTHTDNNTEVQQAIGKDKTVSEILKTPEHTEWQ